MALSEEIVQQAVNVLAALETRPTDIDATADYLSERDEFADLYADALKELAQRALAQIAPPEPSNPRSSGRGASNGQQSAAQRSYNGRAPSAPYRFVVLPDQVVMPEPEAGPLDQPLADGLCAEIVVDWAAETPLLIGVKQGGIVQPMRLGQRGGYVIPGATLRGMLRSATEIVAHGRLGGANLHHRYGLRDFTHPAYKSDSPVSKVAEVKAGWLTLADDKQWRIQPCDWAHVQVTDLLGSSMARRGTTTRAVWIGKSLEDKYGLVGMRTGNCFDFTKNFGFSDSFVEQNLTRVRPGGTRKGTLVFANKLPGKDGNKQLEYVFFDRPSATAVALKPAMIDTFNRLYCKPSKNKPVPNGSWKVLHPTFEKNMRLPVFYVGDLDEQDKGFFFGLTRLFKIPHKRSIGDVLRETQPQHLPEPIREGGEVTGYRADFVENLFGYVVEADALGLGAEDRIAPDAAGHKGRIAFSFAHLRTEEAQTTLSNTVSTVMMAPRASFAPFYLKSNAELDYSAQVSPRLAGRKRYLPRYPGSAHESAMKAIHAGANAGDNQDVATDMRFLMPKHAQDLRFDSRIRLHNVTPAELGAVLFALTHGGKVGGAYRHMIGRAKPQGAGQMRVAGLTLTVTPNRTGRREDSGDLRPYLDAFIAFMRRQPDLQSFPAVPAVEEFLGACDSRQPPRDMESMPLKDFKPIREAVKPLQRGNAPPSRPATMPNQRDGRLLAAPKRVADD